MKKTAIISILAAMALILAACGASPDAASDRTKGSTSQTVSDILDNAAAAQTEAPALTPPTPAAKPADISSPDADVDLTLLNSTMVYSQVYDMVYNPDDYMGKTVKMQGTFAVYEGDTRNYYACLIADATACCAQGIEFEWTGDHTWPEDYPEPGEEITVTGVFDQYQEGQFTYIQLSDAEMF